MKIKGAFPVRWQAQSGKDGTGVTVRSQTTQWAVSTSGTSHPSSGWKTSIPPVPNGQYLWTWTRIIFSDSTETNIYSVSRQGIDGSGIKSSTVTYSQQKSPIAPETITNWGAFPSSLTDGYWLYTKTHIVYSNDDSTDSYSVSQVGTGSYYAGTAEYWAVGTSPTTPPDGAPTPGTYANGQTISTTWSQDRQQTTAATPYLWNFEISADSRGNRYVTQTICIGNFAKGIASIVETYAISSYGSPDNEGLFPSDIAAADWQDEQHAAAPTEAKRYQWNRTVVNYNSGQPDYFYHVSAVKGIDGKGAVYIDLDNENDSMLYDGAGVLISGSATSNIRLYANGIRVTNPPLFSIQEKSAAVSASIIGSVLTVQGITANSGYVIVQCVYNNVTYTARMTVKRLVGVDKFELEVTPNQLSYNATTDVASTTSINVKVYRTPQNGERHLVEDLDDYALRVRIQCGTTTTYLSPITGSNYNSGANRTVDPSKYQSFTCYLCDDDGNVSYDVETIPVNKVANGSQGPAPKSVYKNSFSIPNKPTGATPSGWTNEPEEQTELNIQAQGDWYLTDDGFLTAPLIANSQSSVETITFITTEDNQAIHLRLKCSVSSYDNVYIGQVDSVAPTTNYLRKVSGTWQDTDDLAVTVANAGAHFICVAFQRGYAGSSSYVKFICGNMYLWQSNAMTYNTDGTVGTWGTPFKVSGKDAAFTTQTKTNLLLQTAFLASRMDKWTIADGVTASGLDGRNGFHAQPSLSKSNNDFLRQIIYAPDGEKHLQANTWYTLSFWAKGTSYVQINEYTTSPNYGFATEKCYFAAGIQNTLWVNGYVSSAAYSAGKSLRVFVYNASWSFQTSIKITSTSAVTQSITFIVPETGEYFISSFVYLEPNGHNNAVTDHTATVNWYRIDRSMKMMTYLYPSNLNSGESQNDYTCIDVNAGRIKDGVPLNDGSPTDNNALWQLTEAWTKHTLTFKTRSYIPARQQSFLMRMSEHANEVYVCMVKIEQGTVATDYCTNENDVADIAADATGYPRLRGVWNQEDIYEWNAQYRDFIDYEFGGSYYRFGVRRKGMTIDSDTPPTSVNGDDNWESSHKIQTLITNTIFGTNANIGGFMTSDQRMVSQAMTNGIYNLILDGKNGSITALSADIRGTITAEKFFQKRETIALIGGSNSGETKSIEEGSQLVVVYSYATSDSPVNTLKLPNESVSEGVVIDIYFSANISYGINGRRKRPTKLVTASGENVFDLTGVSIPEFLAGDAIRAYCDGSQWIVLDIKRNVQSNFGLGHRLLMAGRVTGKNSTGSATITVKTASGITASSVTAYRNSDRTYTVALPIGNVPVDDVVIFVTPIGNMDASNSTIYAGLKDIIKTTVNGVSYISGFIVECGDDTQNNDPVSFVFMVLNINVSQY